MAGKRQAKQVDYQALDSSGLVWLAQVDDDKQAMDEIYARKTGVALQIARLYCRRYTFVDIDDMSQSLMLHLPKIVHTYRPGKADWDKYCYHRLYFTAKDILRQRDDLGIMWPQKKQYPDWHRLGDESFEGFEVTDWRAPDEESLELEQLYEQIEAWRAAFAAARSHAGKVAPAASHQTPPRAWIDGRYCGEHPQPSRRKAVQRSGLVGWKRQPKQLAFF